VTPTALLAELRQRGVTIVVDGDGLLFHPRTAVPEDLVVELRRHKTALLRLLPEDAGSEPMGPWRIVVESCHPRPGPIQFNTATTITDPALCIENMLVELERAVLHKNAGRKTAFSELIDEYLEYLTICGCQVRVEPIS
jgi:hypothetical protein